MKVLFVCKGNMSRSPMAESIFNHLTKDGSTAESAGTIPGTIPTEPENWKLADIPYQKDILQVMKEINLDISHKKTRRITGQMIECADLVIDMAEEETRPDFLRESKKVIRWNVPNPGLGYFEALKTRNTLWQKVQSLLSTEPIINNLD